MYLSTIADDTTWIIFEHTLRKLQSICDATARASNVFPVPGGPYSKQPFGGVIPTRINSSGLRNGNSTT